MRATTSLRAFLFLCLVTAGPMSVGQVTVHPKKNAAQQENTNSQTRAPQPEQSGKFSGPGSCAASNCHGSVQPKSVVRISQNEYSIWAAQDKHARAYAVLSNPVSLRIGKILALPQPPDQSDKCLNCHALNVKSELRAQTFQSIDGGVSCESCHGPAVGWLGSHTLKNWTREQSIKQGMYDTRDLSKRTEKCLTCHLGTAEKEVDHTMIAAGHPDLTFQLASFSSSMPRHWKPAPDASPWLGVQELAVGQAVQLREALNRLSRHASGQNWPEFAEYECFACHHSLTKPEASWRQAEGYPNRQPGAPVWNTSTYVVLRHIAGAVDPSTTDQLVTKVNEVMELSGKAGSKEEIAANARQAAGLADRIAQEVQTMPYDRNLTTRLLQEIASDSNAIAAEGERSAEQATMALDSLSLAYVKNEQVANQTDLRAAIDALFQQLGNPSAYNAPRFATQMQKVAKLVPRPQTDASRVRSKPGSQKPL